MFVDCCQKRGSFIFLRTRGHLFLTYGTEWAEYESFTHSSCLDPECN